MMSTEKKVVVRSVWQYNLEHEFLLIQRAVKRFPFASMDTEFPGDIYPRPRPSNPWRLDGQQKLSAVLETYYYMKLNVNQTKLIQLGLTLSDDKGNLPDFGDESSCYVWEFNFREFDINDKEHQNEASIKLLKDQGIDFQKNKALGIKSEDFANLFIRSKLCASRWCPDHGYVPVGNVTWVTFHGSTDFGHLIKILNGMDLPDSFTDFMEYMRIYFGESVYDMKHIVRHCNGLYGGLEKIAKSLQVDRVAGRSHQAGSDSLLTMQTFLKLKEKFFEGIPNVDWVNNFSCKISGLEVNGNNFTVPSAIY